MDSFVPREIEELTFAQLKSLSLGKNTECDFLRTLEMFNPDNI